MAANAKQAARAIDALRRGWPVCIKGDGAAATVYAVETLSDSKELNIKSFSEILITANRAATLKITNQRAAAQGNPVILYQSFRTFEDIMAIIDPTLDLMHPMKGPFQALPVQDEGVANAALDLARLAGLLPGFLISWNSDIVADVFVTPEDIMAYSDSGQLYLASSARLPVSVAEDAYLHIFRSEADAADHVALVIGQRDGRPPVVRLHSECLTGDVLGSLKCDCGPQLHEALHQIAGVSWGVLLYLRQEGRGIGLVNKLRAYALQDQGFDTVDANLRLGFAVDARDFTVAARMLSLLSIDAVRLLTNNPEKVAGLESAGIAVAERLPLIVTPNRHNLAYLATKKTRTGHRL
jgi:GTP cyclohydrolase II